MICSNFLFRVRQWARENEQRIIKTVLAMFVAILIIFLIFYAAESWQASQ